MGMPWTKETNLVGMTYKSDNMKIKANEVYYKGTYVYVKYVSEGVVRERYLLLAETYEEEMVFQVIEIGGYDAGLIRGYIPKEFNDAKCVTFPFLKKMMERFVFPNIIKIRITNHLQMGQGTALSQQKEKKTTN